MRRTALLALVAVLVALSGSASASRSAAPRGSPAATLMARRLDALAYTVTPIMQSGAVAGLRVLVPGESGAVVSIYPMDSALDALKLTVGLQASVAAHPAQVSVTLRSTHVYAARIAAPRGLPKAAVSAIVRAAEGAGGFGADGGGILRVYRVPSPAMEPAIRPGALALFAVRGFTVQPGGIYVIHPNGHGTTAASGDGVASVLYVKRVIGMPGDWVQGVHGLVRICSGPGGRGCRNLDERYVSSTQADFPETRVPAGHYFVMGDDRALSDDSRDWGSIRASQFVGRFVEVLRS
jgi:signal peptidase I